MTILVQLVVGSCLFLFGRHARRNVDRFVPPGLPEDERERRGRVMTRGAWACQAAGVVFVLMIVPVFLD